MRAFILSLVFGSGLAAGALAAQEPTPMPVSRVIRGLRYPSLSPDGQRIVFSYQGDLWTVPVGGGEAKRVGELPGHDVRPRWSPDGKTLAYCSDLLGNLDIYTIPVEGGTPKRLTFHTVDDVIGDWSPDGKSLLFYSARDSRMPTLYSLGVEDGRLRQLARDDQTLQTPVYSPDGQSVAFTRGGSGWARKGYKGSANGEIYTLSLIPGATPKRLTQTPLNEGWPLYSPDGKWLYYTSDADGWGNLWKQPLGGGKPSQVTRQRDGYIHYPALSADGSRLVYETDFSLWTADLGGKGGAPKRLTITASLVEKPRIENRRLTTGASEMEISPDGGQIALGIKGDIYVVPIEGGDAKLLTQSAARDYDFVWSPDGSKLLFVSERDANADLYEVDASTGVTRRLTTDPQPDAAPAYSPDGKGIAFLRGANGKQILTMDVAGGPEKEVVSGAFLQEPRWSPDSRWLAYGQRTQAAITNVFVTPATGGEKINVSRWSGVNAAPTWSPDGKRLAFLSNRGGSSEIFSVDLRKRAPAEPLAQMDAGSPPTVNPVTIDAPGIERRVKQLVTAPAGGKNSIVFSADGRLCFFSVSSGSQSAAYSVPVGGGSATRVAEGTGGSLRLSPDGASLYSLSGGAGLVRKTPIAGGSTTPVPYVAQIDVDLAEERRQTFDQAWRLLRDYFYDPKMHGVDWGAIRSRYRPIVDECLAIQDFHLLLTEMNGELNASHTGASLTNTRRIQNETGSLGLWFDWAGGSALKVTDVLLDGPADDEASRISVGEYVVAVAGKPVEATEAFWQALGGTVGQAIEVSVNSQPNLQGARVVKLTPISRSRFTDLLYEHAVAKNREAVERLSKGRLAYLHIRAMDQPSLQRFEREVLTEAFDHEGLILDVRNNPGGRIHDDLFAILTRKVHVFETPRDGLKMTQPFGAFTKPSLLLINQGSFSDAEIFANGFRAIGLGKIVGVPTGGGVIGTGNLPLLDGETTFRVPRTGWLTLDGVNLENYGVPPDVQVELLPEHVMSGTDPQLETGVAELLRQLAPGGKKGKRN